MCNLWPKGHCTQDSYEYGSTHLQMTKSLQYQKVGHSWNLRAWNMQDRLGLLWSFGSVLSFHTCPQDCITLFSTKTNSNRPKENDSNQITNIAQTKLFNKKIFLLNTDTGLQIRIFNLHYVFILLFKFLWRYWGLNLRPAGMQVSLIYIPRSFSH